MKFLIVRHMGDPLFITIIEDNHISRGVALHSGRRRSLLLANSHSLCSELIREKI